jgi:ribosomal protein S18 acetylase RimI-like enzyme
MPEIRAFQTQDLPQLTQLINQHISMLIPTWGLPSDLILSRLESNPDQPMIDPWVMERKTLCAFVGEQLVAAAHLLRYGKDETVAENHRGIGDIAWFFFYPEHQPEAVVFLEACHQKMRQWEVTKLSAWESGLSIPCLTGIPDKWPHLLALFYEAGYWPNPERAEAIFGGGFETILALAKQEPKGKLLIQDMESLKRYSLQTITDEEMGFCLFDAKLPRERPALESWAELCEISVEEAWRRRGVGRFLLQEMVSYLVAYGIKNIVFSVVQDNDAAIAFYRNVDWNAISRSQDGWEYKGKL